MFIGRVRRVVALVLVVLVIVAVNGAGRFVTREDPLQKSDVIYVLGGAWADRWLEAVDLYHDGYAPHIVISEGNLGDDGRELKRRGVRYLSPGELSRNAMIEQLQIPADAVELIGKSLDNTAQEAAAIGEMAGKRQWRRIIVITDRATTRRGGYAMRRVLGPGIEVVMRSSKLDRFPPDGWWRRRGSFRTVFYELPKLVAYWLGLKG